ncbi:MAG: GNAT family N-acetyltransferase [bacterium]|nr:GNAT family N-acetyltransferase [Planctomycetaceae bacterium]
MEAGRVTILPAHTPDLSPRAAALFREYALSVMDVAGASLAHQNIDAELEGLPGKYGPPKGGMWLASTDGEDVGCVAVRPLVGLGGGMVAGECELKRMYVRPAWRGLGLGRRLVEVAVEFGRGAGYRVMRLDTSDSMHAAMVVYGRAGFVPCERYNDDPMADTLWFVKRLDG